MTKEITTDEVVALFDVWNAAIQTGDPATVAALYDEADGLLLPTLSNKVRHNHEEIADYFVYFLSKSPVGKLIESNVRIFDGVCMNSGVYSFAFADNTEAQARFTYVYRWDGERWAIIEHHSSQMPES